MSTNPDTEEATDQRGGETEVKHLFDPETYFGPQADPATRAALCGAVVPYRPANARAVPPGAGELRREHCPLCALIHAEY